MRWLQRGNTLTRTHVVTISLLAHVLLPHSTIFISARRARHRYRGSLAVESLCVRKCYPSVFLYRLAWTLHGCTTSSAPGSWLCCVFCAVVLDWVHMLTHPTIVYHLKSNNDALWFVDILAALVPMYISIYIQLMHASCHKMSASSGAIRVFVHVLTGKHAICVNRCNQEPNNLPAGVFQFYVRNADMLCDFRGWICGCEYWMSWAVWEKTNKNRLTLQIWRFFLTVYLCR